MRLLRDPPNLRILKVWGIRGHGDLEDKDDSCNSRRSSFGMNTRVSRRQFVFSSFNCGAQNRMLKQLGAVYISGLTNLLAEMHSSDCDLMSIGSCSSYVAFMGLKYP